MVVEAERFSNRMQCLLASIMPLKLTLGTVFTGLVIIISSFLEVVDIS